jgi:hypothetical protein
MATEKKPIVKRKVRADKYEEKVRFDGTLEQMIKMAGDTKISDRKNFKGK